MKTFKNLIAWIIGVITMYVIVGFVMMDTSIINWHWAGRAFMVVWSSWWFIKVAENNISIDTK